MRAGVFRRDVSKGCPEGTASRPPLSRMHPSRSSRCKEDNDKLKQAVRGKAMRSNARGGRYAVGSQGSLISCVHNTLWETVMPATILSLSLKAGTRQEC